MMNRREVLKSLLIALVAASFVAITSRKPDPSDHAAYIQWHFDNSVPVPEGRYQISRTIFARPGKRADLQRSVLYATPELGDNAMIQILKDADYWITQCMFVSL